MFEDYNLSAPASPRELEQHGDMFSPDAIDDLRDHLTLENHYNNCYPEPAPTWQANITIDRL